MTVVAKKMGLHIAGAIIVTLVIYAVSIIPNGPRNVSRLENIYGVKFPVVNGAAIIEESMAHADVFVNQPAFAKALRINIEFIPHETERLEVGIRENLFWLSYPKQTIYTKLPAPQGEARPTGRLTTHSITIPLTDKLQEIDQSLDLMLFVTAATPYLEVRSLTAEIIPATPTFAEYKDYARAILKRERAL